MEKLKKKVTIVLMAIMMTMVFFADAQAKAGCNHKHTGRTWIIAEKANCNHTGRKKQLCVRCRKVLLEKVIPKTKHKWKLTRKRRTRYDCLKCGGVKLKNEYGRLELLFSVMDLENREKEGEKDYEDKKTYCCRFNGTYATGTYARNQYTGKIKM